MILLMLQSRRVEDEMRKYLFLAFIFVMDNMYGSDVKKTHISKSLRTEIKESLKTYNQVITLLGTLQSLKNTDPYNSSCVYATKEDVDGWMYAWHQAKGQKWAFVDEYRCKLYGIEPRRCVGPIK